MYICETCKYGVITGDEIECVKNKNINDVVIINECDNYDLHEYFMKIKEEN